MGDEIPKPEEGSPELPKDPQEAARTLRANAEAARDNEMLKRTALEMTTESAQNRKRQAKGKRWGVYALCGIAGALTGATVFRR